MNKGADSIFRVGPRKSLGGGVLYQSDFFCTIQKRQITIGYLYAGCESSKAIFDGKA